MGWEWFKVLICFASSASILIVLTFWILLDHWNTRGFARRYGCTIVTVMIAGAVVVMVWTVARPPIQWDKLVRYIVAATVVAVVADWRGLGARLTDLSPQKGGES